MKRAASRRSSARVVARLPDVAAARARLHGAPFERYSVGLGGAVLVVLLLFALVQRLIRAPAAPVDNTPTVVHDVRVDDTPKPNAQPKLPAMPTPSAAVAPPTPPSVAAPSLASPQLAAVSAPALDVAPVGLPVNVGSGNDLLGSGAFGGFATAGGGGSGSGGGGGGAGAGGGGGFKGETLIPLSTARPEIPKWAYERKIEGWVEVVFTVDTEGRVHDVRIVDADPKGVFEDAAVKSISHWIYPQQDHPVEVEQRVNFRLKDFQYNWNDN